MRPKAEPLDEPLDIAPGLMLRSPDPVIWDIHVDDRLNALAPSDRWYYIAYTSQLSAIHDSSAPEVLGVTESEWLQIRQRLVEAHLLPRSFR